MDKILTSIKYYKYYMQVKIVYKLCHRKTKKNFFSKKLHPVIQRIYAHRNIKHVNETEYRLRNLIKINVFDDLYKAVNIVYKALINNKFIMIVGDFDVDGATSTAVIFLALKSMGAKKIKYLIPNRLIDGFGLNKKIIDKAKNLGTELIITVDNGISAVNEVQYIREQGMSIIITDHHVPGKILPNANAIINPNVKKFSSNILSLSGVGVVFYFMIALRSYLKNNNWFLHKNLTEPKLANLLDLVAIGTIADLSTLDFNNRILIWQGILRIRKKQSRMGIYALIALSGCNIKNFSCEDISFSIAPRLNAAGRLSSMSLGVDLLLSEDIHEVNMLAKKIDILNQKRKNLEKNMIFQALKICEKLKNKNHFFSSGLIIYFSKWHQGIIGILASRIKEYFFRPVIIFTSEGNGILKGSGRSIPNINILNIIKKISILYPNLILKFGGHAMAIGLSVKEKDFNQFNICFSKITKKYFNNSKVLQKIVWSDGTLSKNELTFATAKLIRDVGPWGIGFPEPIFDGIFIIINQYLIKNSIKLIIKPKDGGPFLNAILFNVNTAINSFFNMKLVRISYKLDCNFFRNKYSFQLIIKSIWPV